ncbi:MAG: alpha-amylase [Cyanophyceae cyanobacterium]
MVSGVMMQYFHWYSSADGQLWNQVKTEAQNLAERGFTALWLPPAYKGAVGGYDNGYGVYDLFDLGEFDQKGSVRTKYGTKDEYLEAIQVAQAAGIHIYADVVLNHRMGADEKEVLTATPHNPHNRLAPSGDPQTIEAWTHFTFPGRQGKYSSMEWHWWHFDAIDYNAYDDAADAIYLFEGKQFDQQVDDENANYDYLMGCDLDFSHPETRGEMLYWGEWYANTTGVNGFRFDAVKHVSAEFFSVWMEHVKRHTQRDLFAVGEYWSYDVKDLLNFFEQTQGKITLLDAPLHHNFHKASKSGQDYDLRQIFDNTLVRHSPLLAVTLVDNHDSQPLQQLESVVEAWFKPLAYALILLRYEGYPCVFYADYYGAHYKDRGPDGNEYEIWLDSHREVIDKMLKARKHHAYGDQHDYFDHPNTLGWVKLGDSDHPGGMAVVLTNSGDGFKDMYLGKPNARYRDLLGYRDEIVITNDEGWGTFGCQAGSVSVWIPESDV